MDFNRRNFLKANAAVAAAGLTFPGISAANTRADLKIRWDKAPCRFCGVGCSVMVGTQNGQVVATQQLPFRIRSGLRRVGLQAGCQALELLPKQLAEVLTFFASRKRSLSIELSLEPP